MSVSCRVFEQCKKQQRTRQWTLKPVSCLLALVLGDVENSSWRGSFPVPKNHLCCLIDMLSSLNRRGIVTVAFSLPFNFNFVFSPSKGQGPGPGAQSLSHHGGCITRNHTVLGRNSEYLPCLGLDCICDLRSLLR